MQAYEFDGPDEVWELYDVKNDFSQSVNLADTEPERLAELRELFDERLIASGYTRFEMRVPLATVTSQCLTPRQHHVDDVFHRTRSDA